MSDLYTFTIFPLELIYKYIYLALYLLIHDYGLALLSLSLLNYFMLMPLNKLVRGISETENQLQQILTPQLQKIKESSSGDVRHQRIQNLYGRYSYHPIYALRNVLPLLIQLPFLMAVYFMVSSLPDLDSVSFLFISNLAQPDGILWGINLLPIVMTLVSLLNACFIVKLSANQKKQAVFVALVFLVLLYNAPSALLVYWTMNNVLILFFGLLAKTRPIQSIVQSLSEVKEKCIPSLLDSSGLFLALCFCVPLCFTLSLNTHMFHEMQISNLLIFILIVSILFLAMGVVFDKLIKRCSNYSVNVKLPFSISVKQTQIVNSLKCLYIKDLFIVIIVLMGASCLTYLCVNLDLYIEMRNDRNIFRLAVIVILILLAKKYSFSLLNILMLSLFVFTGFQLANQKYSNVMDDDIFKTAFDSLPLEERLNNKPNIYVLYLESYMSPRTLRETYMHDISDFETNLTKKGFRVYDHLYSHSSFTNGSLLNLFMMQSNVSALFTGNSDVSAKGHQILGGDSSNLLYTYLKKNGYIISSYYEMQDYYFSTQGKLLDYTLQKISLSYLVVIDKIAPKLFIKLLPYQNTLEGLKAIDVYAPSVKHLQKIKELSQPSFFLIKPLNNLHFSSRLVELRSSYSRWISSGIYQKGIDKMNQELLQFVGEIEKNDPDALIVLIGDHGHKFIVSSTRDYHIFRGSLGDIKSKCPHLNLSSEAILEDFCSVFLAIKMPKTAKGKISEDSPIVYADLFRHIFAALDDNPAFLEYKSEDISVNNIGLILRRADKFIEDGEKSSIAN